MSTFDFVKPFKIFINFYQKSPCTKNFLKKYKKPAKTSNFSRAK